MPFFSVIIPLYNKEKYIDNTLRSVLSQTFSDFEVIIVNDGSTDDSEKNVLAVKDSRIRYFVKENGGVSSARNFGIDKASADYIAFLDADDYWYPNFLKTIHNDILHFPGQSVFGSALEIETAKKTFPAQYSIEKAAQSQIVNYFDASLRETAICPSCAVFHKRVFQNAGVFDDNMKIGEDTDLWIRIGLIYPIVFNWNVMARYVFVTDSLSKDFAYRNVRMDFGKYTDYEKSNPGLKKFLDVNRFSLAIKSKINRDPEHFNKLYRQITVSNLSARKRILLLLPGFALKKLIRLQHVLSEYGLESSVFK